jgi:effector-binding domain-containing protein
MLDAPKVVHTEPLHYAAIRRTCALNEISTIMDAGIKEVLAVLAAQGRTPSGPFFTHHYCRPMEKFDLEICFPVDSPIQPQGDVHPAIWHAMDVARTVFHGNYSGLPGAWGELEKWMQAENYHGRGEFWERYLIGPQTQPNPDNWQTELNWPLAG